MVTADRIKLLFDIGNRSMAPGATPIGPDNNHSSRVGCCGMAAEPFIDDRNRYSAALVVVSLANAGRPVSLHAYIADGHGKQVSWWATIARQCVLYAGEWRNPMDGL